MAIVLQTSFPKGKQADLVEALRTRVGELKKHHPEIENCTLADVSMTRTPSQVHVTLYFLPKDE